MSASLPPLELLKTIGDDTRYAILLALVGARRAMTTAELSSVVQLHANTIRPHLDRMRDAGLVVREVASDGGVGRPRHTYRVAAGAPLMGSTGGPVPRPPAAAVSGSRDGQPGSDHDDAGIGRGADDAGQPGLETVLVDLAVAAGVTEETARRWGFDHGVERLRAELRAAVDTAANGASGVGVNSDDDAIELLVTELERLGFGPRVSGPVMNADGGSEVQIDFTACPFENGVDDAHDVACSLHAGIVAGLASQQAAAGSDVTFFARGETSHRRADCHARVVSASARYDSNKTAHRVGVGSPSSARSEHTKE